jgi:hypothetical protein
MTDDDHKPKTKLARIGPSRSGEVSPAAWLCAGLAALFASLSIFLSYNHDWAAAAGAFPLGLIGCLMFAKIDSDSSE